MEISKLLQRRPGGFKQLGNNAVALTKFNYITEVLPNIDNYVVTDKADGERAFIIARDGAKAILAGGEHPIQTKLKGIFDCEMIDGIFYIFDVLEFEGKNVSGRPFSDRLRVLQTIHAEANIQVKHFEKLDDTNYAEGIRNCLNSSKKYEIDGLIFTSLDKNYLRTNNYKWKPPEKLTIDFLYMSDLLWVGIDPLSWMKFGQPLPKNYNVLTQPLNITSGTRIYKRYFPVPFVCSLGDFSHAKLPKEKDMKVVELSWGGKEWVFHKVRKDRTLELKSGHYYGNNYKIAELTLQSALNPLTKDMLTSTYSNLSKDFYFQKSDDSYKGVRKFTNYVKNILIQQYKTKEVVDLASGKGQDLTKYMEANVSELLMIEIDNNAIDEIINRKYSIHKFIEKKEYIDVTQRPNTVLHVRNLDLNKPYSDNIKFIHIQGNVFCNLALHYLTSNKKDMENICGLISSILPIGGEFVFTALDSSVYNMIKKQKFETDKYLLRLKSEGDFIGIEVKLPCNVEPKEETLINLSLLDSTFAKYNITRIKHETFGHLLDEFKKYKGPIFNEMTAEDIKFAGFYAYTVYKKF